jgi:ribonuclease VapC
VILDGSAILAVLLQEPGHEELTAKLAAAQMIAVGAPTLAETGIVLSSRLGGEASVLLARFLDELRVTTVPFTEPHWREALDAFLRFGKGRHQAALNLGDCLTYATAKVAGLPLLFVGDDFDRTDIERA